MRKLAHSWRLAVPLAVAALALAACGGSDDGLPAPAGPGGLGPIETPAVSGAKVGVKAGNIAPNFRLERTDGSPLELASLRGKPVLLNFWATWCGPCRTEMPEFQRVHERLGDRLIVLSVNQRESPAQVEGFYKELGLTFPAVLDRRARVADAYRLFGLPGTYLIDARGVIQSVKFGPFADEADLLKSLEKAGV